MKQVRNVVYFIYFFVNYVCHVIHVIGSGKTTQVPQYIMENAAYWEDKCRIICTQTRRLAATTIATRIAEERGESIGQSVGYQIRSKTFIKIERSLVFLAAFCWLA